MMDFRRVVRATVASTVFVFAALSAAIPAEAADFYEGKVVTLVVGQPAGSSYDLYARVLAQFLPNHIPGRPTMVVDDMPGANGIVSVQYMINKAARDGTVIAGGVSTLTTYPQLHPDMARFDVNTLSWIGSVTKDIYVAYVWKTAPIQSYEEAKTKQAIFGGIAIGAPTVDLAVVSNALFGTKFKIVTGYVSQSAIELALERGEVQGSFGAGYAGFRASKADWLRDGKAKIILQHGLEKLPDLPDVPLFIDQAKTAEDRTAMEFVLTPQEFAKPYYAPPDIPPERLRMLRDAFDRTVADQDFLAAAAKAHIEVFRPRTGEDVAAAYTKVTNTPRPVIERIKTILENFEH